MAASISGTGSNGALIALKKGAQLIKYSRKGKPKFCTFRISNDETTLIWYSHGKERNLNLSSVLRIIPGQRTAVFRRYLRPEKDYLSFSLIYKNSERSLDLICKDKFQAEEWFAGLKALISTGQHCNRHSKREIPHSHEGGDFTQNSRPSCEVLEFSNSLYGRTSVDLINCKPFTNFPSSDVDSERANMQLRMSTGDGSRTSVSSTPSSFSQSSGPDDIESLGDVYVWGEVLSDGAFADKFVSPISIKNDVLTPKPLESNVVLDVHQIACGVRHFALVTRQGEVFTWGEEAGGRLGHGIHIDFSRPHLVEYFAVTNVDSVACGEYHTCSVSSSGDLYSWGDGTYNAGLLGHGSNVSHWIPKKVSGPLEGLHVLSVACGTWHSALVTSSGKLFTFGDGSFGVLGHGDRESMGYPREVQLLIGLKTIKVACGVWHTAAIVEVMSQSDANVVSRKLFTWGDGNENRLGHGNKETYLLPTCVSAVIDYNFHQIACGHSMTVALTTSGHVFTMGGTAHGQLGSPKVNGVLPYLVQDRLVGEFVEEISCGAYHVAVLTSRNEVFTWGCGANGRLGHGDTEDRNYPTLVEALKDKNVRSISCGSTFTASICIHKWVSGVDQSVCSGCRQAFGFTKKRHNCYNCGLVHCHACSSRKALRAALAPAPGKPHRVCDSCYAKLKASEAGGPSYFRRKTANPHHPTDIRDKVDRGDVRSSRTLLSPFIEPINYLDVKSLKPEMKVASFSIFQASQIPVPSQPKAAAVPISMPYSMSAISLPPPKPAINSRNASPRLRRPSPTRAAAPVFFKSVIDSLKKTNEFLNEEVAKLQNQVKSLEQKFYDRDVVLQRLHKNSEESTMLAREELSKHRVARDVVKSVATQLKEISIPPEIYESETFKMMQHEVEAFLNTSEAQGSKFSSFPKNTDLRENHVDARVTDSLSTQKINKNSLESEALQENSEISSKSLDASTSQSPIEKEIVELYEPGVYVTCLLLQNGAKIFKRVKFSKRRFQEQQAEAWWNANKDRLLKKYSHVTLPYGPQTKPPRTPAPSEDNQEAGPSSQT